MARKRKIPVILSSARERAGRRATTRELMDYLVDYNAGISEAFALMSARFDRVDAKLVEHDGRFERLEFHFSSLDRRVGNIETRLENVEHRVGRIETRLERVEHRTGRIETKLENVERRLPA